MSWIVLHKRNIQHKPLLRRPENQGPSQESRQEHWSPEDTMTKNDLFKTLSKSNQDFKKRESLKSHRF